MSLTQTEFRIVVTYRKRSKEAGMPSTYLYAVLFTNKIDKTEANEAKY